MAEDRPILIVGGGIGGLAAACGLARKGFRSLVLEKADELSEIGAGIQLGPNAFHAFDYLGVGEAARALAVYVDSVRFMDAISGEEVMNLAVDDEFVRRFKDPYAVVHRGDLHQVFVRACAASDLVELRTSAQVVDYEQDGETVSAILADGTRVAGRALVGADGLWSKIRKRLVDDGLPRVSGHTTYRSVIPTADMPEDLRWNASVLWGGPKCHIVHYPLQGGEAFNLVVTYHNDAPEPVMGLPVDTEMVRRGFDHVHPRPRQVIERGRNWKLWVLCDRDPVTSWTDGRATLLGDAAHPMMQYMAQGACMAMEDAVCLSAEMEAASGDAERAFPAYQAKRAPRTARVQLQSRWVGDYIFHPDGAHAQLRNMLMRSKTQTEWLDAFEWLYGANGLEGGPAGIGAGSKPIA
jgi:salicylate hydroxylase